MEVGIFAKTFPRPTLEETLDAVVSAGLRTIQFNMACAQLPSMPERIDAVMATSIAHKLHERGIEMAAVSGTFNMIHPDPGERAKGIERLRVLAGACGILGTSIITLCTGTRDPHNMWQGHPENDSTGAWRDLCEAIERAVDIAELNGVTLAFEPEVSNIVDSAPRARRLLDEMKSARLKVAIDAANLFPAGTLPRMDEILGEAFDLLGEDIVLAHAKDLSVDGAAGHEAAGTGELDYDQYLTKLSMCGYTGPLILHGLSEAQVNASVEFLREKLGKR